jgi:ribonuclease VapC
MMGRDPARKLADALLAEAEQGQTRLLMSAINAGEVYYILRKNHSEAVAESWQESSATLPATLEVPGMDDIWRAAILKSRYRIAYADAFAAALAQRHACPLVTGDPEFRSVAQLQLEWIPRRRS